MTLATVSESNQWWQNMAVVVIFGLMVATFLTLVVVPVLYTILASTQQRLRMN
jgi:multidrug efflux pump subunit AcrB